MSCRVAVNRGKEVGVWDGWRRKEEVVRVDMVGREEMGEEEESGRYAGLLYLVHARAMPGVAQSEFQYKITCDVFV